MSKEIEWLKKLKRGSEKEYPCGSVQDNELVVNNKEKLGLSTKGMPLPARKGFSAVAGMEDLKLRMKEGLFMFSSIKSYLYTTLHYIRCASAPEDTDGTEGDEA